MSHHVGINVSHHVVGDINMSYHVGINVSHHVVGGINMSLMCW